MNIFQIPRKDEEKKEMIIGVIDCSGSMEPSWPWLVDHWNRCVPRENLLTITFDNKTSKVPNNELNIDILEHGGGGTKIVEAFELLEAELAAIPKEVHVTVLFISDGEDNDAKSLEQRFGRLKGSSNGRLLNFLCLGVGDEFPTFLAMRLRSLYHSGDPTIPAIFLIEFPSEQAFANKFEQLSPFFEMNLPRRVTPAVCALPWREPVEQVYELSWVMTREPFLSLDGEEVDLSEFDLNLKGICPLFRSWAQMLLLEALKDGESVVERAKKTLSMMETIIQAVKEKKNIDLLGLDEVSSKMTFCQKAEQTFLRRNLERVKWYYRDVQDIVNGVTSDKMAEFDAAKKIGAGTVQGNYGQKLMQLKEVGQNRFDEIVSKFRQILGFNIKALTPEEDDEKSLKSVVKEADFDRGLAYCANQLDLLDSFPLPGFGVRLSRPPGSSDPWEVKVEEIVDRPVDSASIVRNKGAVVLQTDEGQVSVNAVLPFVGSCEESLAQILDSELFRMIFTHNVIREEDKISEDAHLALLCRSVDAILAKPQIEFRERLLDCLRTNFELLRAARPSLKAYENALIESPLRVLLDPSSLPSESRFHPLLAQLVSVRAIEHSIPEAALRPILEAQFLSKLHELKHKDGEFSDKVLTLKFEDSDKFSTELSEEIREGLSRCRTLGDFNRLFLKRFADLSLKKQPKFIWTPENLVKGDQKWKTLLRLWERAFKAPIPQDLVLRMALAVLGQESWENYEKELRCESEKEISERKETLEQKLLLKFRKEITENQNKTGCMKKGKGKAKKKARGKEEANSNAISKLISFPLFVKMKQDLLKELEELFISTHDEIYPLSKREVEKFSEVLNLKDLIYDEETGFVRNACMARKCASFLRPVKRIGRHFHLARNWIPLSFHKTVQAHLAKPAQEILQIFLRGGEQKPKDDKWTYDPSKYRKSEEEVLKYIERVIEAYRNLNED